MKIQKIFISGILWGGMLFSASCSTDYLEPAPVVSNPEGLRISMGGPLTRSAHAEAVLGEMRLYCFDRSALGGIEPAEGSSSTYSPAGVANPMSPFHHIVQGLSQSGMTLYTNLMRTGKWDLAMVAHRGATFTAPVAARRADQLPMYTFDPAQNGGMAHEFYHSYSRLPEVTSNNHPYTNTAVSRNVAKIRVVIERATDVQSSAPAGSHTVTLDGIPQYISWAGTLLKNTSGNFTSDKNNFDVFPNGSSAFVKNVIFTAATEAGSYQSDTLDYIIPAYRGSDFWQVNPTTNALEMNPSPSDTLTRKMTLSVSFTKLSGGTFTKSVTVPRVAQCNKILLLRVRMNDVNVEINPSIQNWSPNDVEGNVGAAYLNVSRTATEIYDGAVSRIYFWSNQPVGSVYVTNEGKTATNVVISDVNTIFDRLAGSSATNLHYDANTKEGYVDICQSNTSTALTDQITKIYLNAGGLKREVVVKRSVTAQAAKGIATPYVGAFHRASQTGERVITWNYAGDWNAVVEGPAAGEVLLDRQPSPAFNGGTLYSTNPGEAEPATVSDWGGSVSGKGRIYFRTGWKSRHTATEATPARYANVVVREGLVAGSGQLIQTLYLRQGEEADYLMNPGDKDGNRATIADNRAFAKRLSPYNLTSPDRNPAASGTPLAINGGAFVLYPSQAGAFFQWVNENKIRYAYHPISPVSGWQNNYPPTFWEVLGATHETCPAGYRRPNDGSISGANATGGIASSEMRQSLWQNPPVSVSPNLDNSVWGYYADGFFDRGEIISSVTSDANSTVSPSGANTAYIGRLFFHPDTKASLFFPAAGTRGNSNGSLGNAGGSGYYWSSSAPGPDDGWILTVTKDNVRPINYTRSSGLSIRCIANEKATLTFHANGATGAAPAALATKELAVIPMPGKGSMNKGTEFFSGWNTAPDGSGTNYAAGSNFVVPIGGAVTLYARWLYMEESEEIVIPNNSLLGNVREVEVHVSGGHDNTFSILDDGPKWFTPSIINGKLRITAPQSPAMEARESTITLEHNSDRNYKLVLKVSQHFFTDIPPFDYFVVQFTWPTGGDMDVAVEFTGNNLIGGGKPTFDNKPVGMGFKSQYDMTASYVKVDGNYQSGGTTDFANAMSQGGLLFWGGDGKAATSGESVFFNAQLIDNSVTLERYIKLDVYNTWFNNPNQATAQNPITMTISAFKGGIMKYEDFMYSGTTTNLYTEPPRSNRIKVNGVSGPVYPNIRSFVNNYQKIATITYDRKSHKATVQWH